jgi:hypothetical protein
MIIIFFEDALRVTSAIRRAKLVTFVERLNLSDHLEVRVAAAVRRRALIRGGELASDAKLHV